MRPFSQWVSDMANSIEDASTIVKDENGEIVLPEHKTFADKYETMYDGPQCHLTQEELAEHWARRFEDNDDYFD